MSGINEDNMLGGVLSKTLVLVIAISLVSVVLGSAVQAADDSVSPFKNDPEWTKDVSGSDTESYLYLQRDSDGNLYLVRNGVGSHTLVSLDKDGNLRWNDTAKNESIEGFRTDQDGNSYLLSKNISSGKNFLRCVNSQGEEQWSKELPSSLQFVSQKRISIVEQSIYLISKGKVYRYGLDGEELLSKNISASGAIVGEDGSFYCVTDETITRYGKSGNKEWNHTISGDREYFIHDVATYDDGTVGLLYLSTPNSTDASEYNLTALKLNNQGEEKWDNTFGPYTARSLSSFIIYSVTAGEKTFVSMYYRDRSGEARVLFNGLDNDGKKMFGKQLWKGNTKLPHPTMGKDGKVYVSLLSGSQDEGYRSIHSFDKNGDERWNHTVTNTGYAAPPVVDSDGNVYVINQDGVVSAYVADTSDGDTDGDGTDGNKTDGDNQTDDGQTPGAGFIGMTLVLLLATFIHYRRKR